MKPTKEPKKNNANISFTQKVIAVIMILSILAYYFANFTPTLYGMPNDGIFSNFGQSIVSNTEVVLPYMIGLLSAVVALLIGYKFYKKLNKWDRAFKISIAMYVFMIFSFATNIILAQLTSGLFISHNYSIESTYYVSYNPINMFWQEMFVGIVSSIIALTFTWFYAKVDVSIDKH